MGVRRRAIRARRAPPPIRRRGTGAGAATRARIGGERGEETRVATPAERRHWLMRIARGEWTWPHEEDEESAVSVQPASSSSSLAAAAASEVETEPAELVGASLVRSRGAQRIVTRLLVRNTRKRARIAGSVGRRVDVF